MAEIGSWNGFIFEVSPTRVRGFKGLTIRGGSETEEKVSGKYKYVERLNGSPTEVTIEVYLNAYLGCDVRDEAMAFVNAATEGEKNYFYVAGKKLLPVQLMLTGAEVTETEHAPTGEWVSCRINLTMKQCEKYPKGSSGSGGSSSSGNGSSGSSQPKKETVKQQSWTEKPAEAVKSAVSAVTEGAKKLVNAVAEKIAAVPSSAKTVKKTTTTAAESSIKKKVSAAKQATTGGKKATAASKKTTTASAVKKTSTAKGGAAKGKITAVAK